MSQRCRDANVYAWAFLLLVVVSGPLPPALALVLLFPRWHAVRVRRRLVRHQVRAEAVRTAVLSAYLDGR